MTDNDCSRLLPVCPANGGRSPVNSESSHYESTTPDNPAPIKVYTAIAVIGIVDVFIRCLIGAVDMISTDPDDPVVDGGSRDLPDDHGGTAPSTD